MEGNILKIYKVWRFSRNANQIAEICLFKYVFQLVWLFTYWMTLPLFKMCLNSLFGIGLRDYMTFGNSVLWVRSLVVWFIVTICVLWPVNGLAEAYGDHFWSLGIGKHVVYGIFMKQGKKADWQNVRPTTGSLDMSSLTLITLSLPLILSSQYLSWASWLWLYTFTSFLLLRAPLWCRWFGLIGWLRK